MSRTTRSKSLSLTLVAGFIVTLGAGVVVGMAAGRHEASAGASLTNPAPTTVPPSPGRVPPIDKYLELTKDQSDQMKAIWSEFQTSFHKNNERRNALLKERDDALFNLLTDEQKIRHQQLMAEYRVKLDALAAEQGKEREKAFQDAVERTKKILTETQRQKYEQLLQKHGPSWHRGGHGEHGGPAHPPRRGQWPADPDGGPGAAGPVKPTSRPAGVVP